MPKTIDTNGIKIDRLITRIEEGDIKIPPLQRPFVWKVDQIIKLLESIYLDYPVGSILLWETNEDLPATRSVAGFEIPKKKPDYPHNYVLDGQQRLSALYGVFCTKRKKGLQPHGYEIDYEDFEIFFDVDRDKFIHKNYIEGGKYFEAKYLLDSVKFVEALDNESFNKKDREKLKKLHSIFSNYEIPLITTKKRDRSEVGIIFERINNSGTNLGLFDLMVAWTWTENFHLQEKFDELFDSLERKNFSGIQNKIVLQCLSSILKESSASKVILALQPEEIRKNFKLLQQSLEKAVDYFSTEFSVKSIELLPHSHQIVPLCFFFSKIHTPNSKQKKAINEWFWKTSFSDRYSSSTDSHIDEDIVAFKKVLNGQENSAFIKLKYSISAEQIRETVFSKSNAFSRAFIVLLANKLPRNLVNGSKVDTGNALSSFNKKEYHHIFPKAFLSSKGLRRSEIFSLVNFCIIPSDSNKKISDKSPSFYFLKIIPQKKWNDILESNLLPIKKEIYKKNNFTLFLEERSKIIVNYVDSLLV